MDYFALIVQLMTILFVSERIQKWTFKNDSLNGSNSPTGVGGGAFRATVSNSRKVTSSTDDGVCPSHYFFIIFSPLHNSDINAFAPAKHNWEAMIHKDIIVY